MPLSSQPSLSRSLSLTQATLYGLGVTIGAGIYVLVGTTVARAGPQTPIAFALAAILMGLTAASFAELAARFPVAAGEAAYARTAFGSNALATAVGLLVVAIAIVSAAAISVGSAGYVGVFVALPQSVLILLIVLSMGGIAALGVKESVGFAAAITVVEIGGLIVVILAGFLLEPKVFTALPEILPREFSPTVVAGLMSATLIAVFAFVGFEGISNIAEEVRNPARALPRAIFLTLIVSTVLYVLVVWISLASVDRAELAHSPAPLALVFERLTGISPTTMSIIASVATLNGIVVQIIMSSRVLYGVAHQGGLPARFAAVSATTHTPVFATAFTTALILVFALTFPLHNLAESTSRLTLLVFTVVNLSLARIKQRDGRTSCGVYTAPTWVPYAGAAACIALLAADVLFLGP
ncbi:MAG: amino acid permease [Rhodospirillales bacterium]|nr:amino acid permease [Rhodospirillales bacterium]